MDTKIKSAKTFSEDEMTVKEFLAYLKTKYIANLNGKPFTVNYAHSLLNYGRMPRHYGGNILEFMGFNTHYIDRGWTDITILHGRPFHYQKGRVGIHKKFFHPRLFKQGFYHFRGHFWRYRLPGILFGNPDKSFFQIFLKMFITRNLFHIDNLKA